MTKITLESNIILLIYWQGDVSFPRSSNIIFTQLNMMNSKLTPGQWRHAASIILLLFIIYCRL